MAELGSLGLDFLTRITNIHWGGLALLYSGADGMFGSEDGETWKEAPASVPATSLAWMNDVWVGCNPEVGCWYSEDGAKSWTGGGPSFKQVAAMQPAGLDDQGKPNPGMFAGYDSDGKVYTSSDGKSWAVALTIAADLGDEGSEGITGLSGCGGAFFVGTVSRVNSTSANTATFYSSFDGSGFTSQTVATGTFWDGDRSKPPPSLFTGYSPGGVGFDKKTKVYLATIQKEEGLAGGTVNTYMQVSASGGGSFGEGTPIATGSLVSGEGDSISVYSSVAGGDGTFVGGSALRHFNPLQTGGEVRAHWLPGGSAQTLESYSGAVSDEFIGSFCFTNFEEEDTEEMEPTEPKPGVFACVAYGAGAAGGVFIAKAGKSFRKTHSGTGIVGVEVAQPAGAVAVGELSWLGEAEDEA